MGAARVEALLFDVFGTVVDWRSSVIRELTAFGFDRGLRVDWRRVADEWRGEYQPAMEAVRSGRREWTILDVLHRESLERVLERHGLTGLADADLDHLTGAWHRLDPWPDAVEGLTRLRERFIVGTLSNGNVGLLARLARHGRLPWDVILCAETARAYKPLADAYLRNAALLNLPPERVMLVAAHNGDLAAAAALGFRTAFVARLTEHGPNQRTDLEPTGRWDAVAGDFLELADALADTGATVSGSVVYRERIALPPDAVVVVQLVDVSRAEALATVIAEHTQTTGARQVPIPFSLAYDPVMIDEQCRYAIRATIHVDGDVWFGSTDDSRVITGGNPTGGIEVLVRMRASA